jgi:hypothetical protein
MRRHLNISPNYPGVMPNMVFYDSLLSDLLSSPVGKVASDLRKGVDPAKGELVHLTRALATALDRTPDKKTFSFMSNIDLSSDLMLSSWAGLDLYELDFGLGLGKPEAVRRPATIAVEGLMYLMPKRKNGEIALGLCLRDEDMERLKMDQRFIQYARFIG